MALVLLLTKVQIHATVFVYDHTGEGFWTKWSLYLTTDEVTFDLDSLPKSQGNFLLRSLELELNGIQKQ